MADLSTIESLKELIGGLLRIGSAPEIEPLFDLIVKVVPTLVDAQAVSIFWKDGPWRDQWRREGETGYQDAFYRRAIDNNLKLSFVGIQHYISVEGLTGWVIKHGSTLRIDDITDEAELKKIADDLTWKDKHNSFKTSSTQDYQRAFLAVPVKNKDEVLGIIRVTKTIQRFGKFNKKHQELLESFAPHTLAIIERVEETNRKDLWEELYLSGLSLGRGEFPGYLQKIIDKVPKYLGAQVCSIFLTEDMGGKQRLLLSATTSGTLLSDKVGKAIYEWGEGLTGWVAKHNKPLRLNNVTDERERQQYGSDLIHLGKHGEYVREHLAPLLACPIQKEGKVLGVIRVRRDARGKTFSLSEQRFLEGFCRNLAVVVENAQSYEEIKRKSAEIEALQSVTGEILSSHNVKNVFDLILDKALEVTKGEIGTIRIIDPTTKDLVAKAYRTPVGIEINQTWTSIPFGKGVTGISAATKEAIIVHDIKLEPEYIPYFEGMQSEIAIPLLADNEVIGVIS